MTNSVQNEYQTHASPSEPYRVNKIRRVTAKSGLSALELEVKIKSKTQVVLLLLDEIREYVPSDPELVNSLTGMHNTLNTIAGDLAEIRKIHTGERKKI